MKRWEKYSKEELEQFVRENYSYRSVAEKVGYNPDSGSGITAIKEMIALYNFDISHFTGQGWNKGKTLTNNIESKTTKTTTLKRYLIKERGYKCEHCGLSEWNNQPIELEVHHKDGNHLNNEIDNLELLCPNCHAQTKNYKSRNNTKEHIKEEDFVTALIEKPNIRQALISLNLTPSSGNYNTAYKLMIKYKIEK